jgi:hypothetical protein
MDYQLYYGIKTKAMDLKIMEKNMSKLRRVREKNEPFFIIQFEAFWNLDKIVFVKNVK